MTFALEELKVIDVSQGVAGPFCAMILGDMGAEVIKVEPLEGDWLRQIGPFEKGESALFLRLNRNKRGISVNLKTDEGKEILRRLARDADILVEGYRPGAMASLGLSYEDLAPSNPRLIYCSIPAYGSAGPMGGLRGSELDVQAMMGVNRHLGTPSEPPVRAGTDIVSVNAAWGACQAIMAALLWRNRSGEGQRVETSLLDAGIGILQWTITPESDPDEWAGRPMTGYTEPPDYGFQCKDKSFLMDLGRTDADWVALCKGLRAEQLITDSRFNDRRKRQENQFELKQELVPILANWRFEDVQSLVQRLGGTIVPMYDLEELANHPQLQALDMVKELEHPTVGKYKTLDIPWDFSELIGQLSPVPAPRLGEHTHDLLSEVGYSKVDISRLFAAKVVA